MDHARAYEEHDTPDDGDSTPVPKGNSYGDARLSTPELAAPPNVTVAQHATHAAIANWDGQAACLTHILQL
jgi:hypothetical protein